MGNNQAMVHKVLKGLDALVAVAATPDRGECPACRIGHVVHKKMNKRTAVECMTCGTMAEKKY